MDPASSSDAARRWRFQDVFLALGIALDPFPLAIAYGGLMVGAGLFAVLFALGRATGEVGAPGTFAILGGLGFVAAWILTAGILARVVSVRLLEGRQASPREVWAYLHRCGRTLLLIPAGFAATVLTCLAGVGALGVLGRLPGIGPLLFGTTFSVSFLLALAAVVALLLHTAGGLLYPTIVATREEGLRPTITELLALARDKGVVLALHTAAILVGGTVATLLLTAVASAALALVAASARGILGDQWDSILAGLPSAFQPFLEWFGWAFGNIPEAAEVPWHFDLGGLLLGVSLLSIFAATASFPFVLVNAAGGVAYFALTDRPLPDILPTGPGAGGPSRPREAGAP